MSEDLTERWKNGELTVGSYYVKDASGRVFIDEYIKILYGDDVEPTVFRREEVIVEVLAHLPSYDQFSQMVKKVEELEKLLKECKGVIDECVRSDYIEELKERIDEVLR